MERKNLETLLDCFLFRGRATARYQAMKRRVQHIEDNAFHQGNFVLKWRMVRAIALLVTLLTSAMIALAADQPSNSDEPGEFDIEPPILKQNLSDELADSGTAAGGVARCEKKLERAKRNAAGAE